MRKTYTEMVGEALREVGVLVLVFSLLDRLIAGRITLTWVLSAIAVSIVVFVYGCFLERSVDA